MRHLKIAVLLTALAGMVNVAHAQDAGTAEPPMVPSRSDGGPVAVDADPVGAQPAAVPTPGDDTAGWFARLADHAKQGEWVWALGLLIVGITWAFRSLKWLKKLIPWDTNTKLGAAALALLVSLGTVIGTELGSTGQWSWSLVGVAVSAWWASAGQWGHGKDAKKSGSG